MALSIRVMKPLITRFIVFLFVIKLHSLNFQQYDSLSCASISCGELRTNDALNASWKNIYYFPVKSNLYDGILIYSHERYSYLWKQGKHISFFYKNAIFNLLMQKQTDLHSPSLQHDIFYRKTQL